MKYIYEAFESELRHENVAAALRYLSKLDYDQSQNAKVAMDRGAVFVFHFGDKPEGFKRG